MPKHASHTKKEMNIIYSRRYRLNDSDGTKKRKDKERKRLQKQRKLSSGVVMQPESCIEPNDSIKFDNLGASKQKNDGLDAVSIQTNDSNIANNDVNIIDASSNVQHLYDMLSLLYTGKKTDFLQMAIQRNNLKFAVVDVIGDGNCFWRAIAQGLFSDQSKYNDVKRNVAKCMRDSKTAVMEQFTENLCLNTVASLDEANYAQEMYTRVLKNVTLKNGYVDNVSWIHKIMCSFMNITLNVYSLEPPTGFTKVTLFLNGWFNMFLFLKVAALLHFEHLCG